MNLVQLKGRTVADVALMGGEKKYCFFRVACDRTGAKNTDFIDCKAFGKLAESISEKIKKGNLVSITGHIQNSSYEKNGETKYSTMVVIDDIVKHSVSSMSTGEVREENESVVSED